MNKHLRNTKMWLTAAMMIVSAGCGGGGGTAASSQPGTLGVSLTDAPSGGFDAVNVTVAKVRVHQSATANENDAGWTDITLSPARKINLLNLTNGALEDLGQTPLPAGHYSQLRLVLVANQGANLANSVVLSGTIAEIALDTPSAVQSGIKLINQFDVGSGQRVDLVLDFDASKSIVTAGGSYKLKPVIKVIPTALNGIDGYVDTFLPASNVRVSAQQNGVIIGSTAPNALTGEFFIARLAAGNYDLVFTADGCITKIVAGVPVASAPNITVVSSRPVPITLPVATTSPITRNINGTVAASPVSPTDQSAFVAAKQAVGSSQSLTVTVKFQAVDPASGTYGLALPLDAPLLGQYGSGALPITFSAQNLAVGQYKIEASMAGYQTQSVSKDITFAAASQDFTLTP